MLGKIPFPHSLLLALLVPPAAWAFLRLAAPAGRRPTALAVAVAPAGREGRQGGESVRVCSVLARGYTLLALRALLAVGVAALPLVTSGPGPVQLTLGLLSGYLGIRFAALAAREASRPTLASATLAAVTVRDLFEPVPPDPGRRAGRALAIGLGGAAACAALMVAGNELRLWRVSRLADDLLVYLEVAFGATGFNNLLIAGAALTGRSVAGLLVRPALSASLAEFWAARWNRLVGRNLDRGFFRPLCRAGHPRAGVVAAFTASGIMHVLPVLAAAPWSVAARPAAVVMGFFLLHGALVLAERALGWHRAPDSPAALARARLRTLLLFAALSPMLLGPFAEICGVHGRSLAGLGD